MSWYHPKKESEIAKKKRCFRLFFLFLFFLFLFFFDRCSFFPSCLCFPCEERRNFCWACACKQTFAFTSAFVVVVVAPNFFFVSFSGLPSLPSFLSSDPIARLCFLFLCFRSRNHGRCWPEKTLREREHGSATSVSIFQRSRRLGIHSRRTRPPRPGHDNNHYNSRYNHSSSNDDRCSGGGGHTLSHQPEHVAAHQTAAPAWPTSPAPPEQGKGCRTSVSQQYRQHQHRHRYRHHVTITTTTTRAKTATAAGEEHQDRRSRAWHRL